MSVTAPSPTAAATIKPPRRNVTDLVAGGLRGAGDLAARGGVKANEGSRKLAPVVGDAVMDASLFAARGVVTAGDVVQNGAHAAGNLVQRTSDGVHAVADGSEVVADALGNAATKTGAVAGRVVGKLNRQAGEGVALIGAGKGAIIRGAGDLTEVGLHGAGHVVNVADTVAGGGLKVAGRVVQGGAYVAGSAVATAGLGLAVGSQVAVRGAGVGALVAGEVAAVTAEAGALGVEVAGAVVGGAGQLTAATGGAVVHGGRVFDDAADSVADRLRKPPAPAVDGVRTGVANTIRGAGVGFAQASEFEAVAADHGSIVPIENIFAASKAVPRATKNIPVLNKVGNIAGKVLNVGGFIAAFQGLMLGSLLRQPGRYAQDVANGVADRIDNRKTTVSEGGQLKLSALTRASLGRRAAAQAIDSTGDAVQGAAWVAGTPLVVTGKLVDKAFTPARLRPEPAASKQLLNAKGEPISPQDAQVLAELVGVHVR